uniref:hypothetical protein n=1 Tax=Vaginimicrobium propionicum TaxID=1871034 RepID=UPI0015715738|nr:hypothetical protein [Vaginimicrobium propionicum]
MPVFEANGRGSVRADSDVARESMEGCGVTLEREVLLTGFHSVNDQLVTAVESQNNYFQGASFGVETEAQFPLRVLAQSSVETWQLAGCHRR